MFNYTEQRPWGRFKVLIDNPDFKVKEILVNPGNRLSYQMHQKRSEHWFIVSGEAYVTINDQDFKLKQGQSIDIPVLTKHRVANITGKDLIFIEIQTGTYFGEDDIQRFSDDYGRIG